MQNKLYYQDPYLQTFAANIIDQKKDEQGRWYVVLNETAFYPTGGGQPHDAGILNEKKVYDVEELDGEIRHYIEEPFSTISESVTGTIDWERRFDHMQQHAGQHILSAAFEELFEVKTVSFHLGKETATIDIDIPELSEEMADQAEKRSNQIILENRPIETKWVSETDVKDYPLRKELSVADDIRLVIIPEFDYNGCGGTHPRSTGEVAGIKILSWETQRKKIRVQFVCGNRILQQLHNKQRVVSVLSQLLNASEQELTLAANRLLEKNKETEKQLEEAKEVMLQQEAQQLINDKSTLITKVFENRSVKELQPLARLIVGKKEDVVVIFVTNNDKQLQFVCATGMSTGVDLKNRLTGLLPLINGKGGGNATFFQGGGETLLSPEEFLSQVEKVLK